MCSGGAILLCCYSMTIKDFQQSTISLDPDSRHHRIDVGPISIRCRRHRTISDRRRSDGFCCQGSYSDLVSHAWNQCKKCNIWGNKTCMYGIHFICVRQGNTNGEKVNGGWFMSRHPLVCSQPSTRVSPSYLTPIRPSRSSDTVTWSESQTPLSHGLQWGASWSVNHLERFAGYCVADMPYWQQFAA
jgi:hypothetical protein